MSVIRKQTEVTAPESKKLIDLDKLEAKLARLNREAEMLGEAMRRKPREN